MFEGINAIEFSKRFYNNDTCYQYLAETKWGREYLCKKCGCDQFNRGRTSYHRRCRECGYDESVTANTLFHDVKMPILKAFHMMFRVVTKKKGMSTVELAGEVGVQQKTAWLFKRKLQVAMKPVTLVKLKGDVDVDEFLTGGKDENQPGRSLNTKEATLIAIEKVGDDQIGSIYIKPIENFQADTLKYAIKEGIDEQAAIRTDNYSSYKKLDKEMGNITRVESDNGKNFIEVHQMIMLFKMWLRGIHHKCSTQHYHAYCDEYSFRFNKRNNRKRIFDRLVARMLHQHPHPYSVLKTLCVYST